MCFSLKRSFVFVNLYIMLRLPTFLFSQFRSVPLQKCTLYVFYNKPELISAMFPAYYSFEETNIKNISLLFSESLSIYILVIVDTTAAPLLLYIVGQ